MPLPLPLAWRHSPPAAAAAPGDAQGLAVTAELYYLVGGVPVLAATVTPAMLEAMAEAERVSVPLSQAELDAYYGAEPTTEERAALPDIPVDYGS